MNNLIEKLQRVKAKLINLPENSEAVKEIEEIIEDVDSNPQSYFLKPPPATPPRK